jgi:diphosphomevalonate decarboxylase
MKNRTGNTMFEDSGNKLLQPMSGCVAWESPSNIALIKYWGKYEHQLPMNASLSFTLSESVTRTKVQYEYNPILEFNMELYFKGKSNTQFADRLSTYLQSVTALLPFIGHTRFRIESDNTFPHSAGIASSASAYAALALDLCTMEEQICSRIQSKNDFFRKASYLARLGSGSAARSVYGGLVLWGTASEFPASGDKEAMPVTENIHAVFRDYGDAILVVDSQAKTVSSSQGHLLMEHHPYAQARVVQASHNLSRLLAVLGSGDLQNFAEVVEHEALSLHALMLSSNPGLVLLKPATLEILINIRRFRNQTGLPVAFTLDAGPNVHLLYPVFCEQEVRSFVRDNLLQYCENNRVIFDHVGKGPVRIT